MKSRGTIPAACLAFAATCLALAVNGCGGDGSSGASAAIPSSAPALEVPAGLPPRKLVVKDLHEGTGKEAHKGDKVKIQYYGISWENGAEHANSWRYPQAPAFKLGKHQLLRGLNMAIPGMKEGGGREVVIPSNLVYYPGDLRNESLGRLSALIYKVYLVKVLDSKR